MSDSVRIFQVDAFTTERFSGNPAGVVLDADDLSDTQMQLIARELNNGDTAFLLKPDAEDHDLRVRFFTPRAEAGFVGHATVAAHAVLAQLGHRPLPRQKQRTGIVQVSVQHVAGRQRTEAATIAIAQPPPRLQSAPPTAALAEALTALGISQADLDQRLPPIIAGDASTRLLLAVNDAAALSRLTPDLSRLAALSNAVGAPGYFLYTLNPALPNCHTEARMYCPALGIPEDPVSGNAHGMLGAYLWRLGLLPAGGTHFVGTQGHFMGRAGTVRIDVQQGGSALTGVTINGRAIVVFETTISL
jgi:PhzF family phenazine biosynthesis protein